MINFASKSRVLFNVILILGIFLIISDFIESLFNFKFPTGTKHVIFLTTLFLLVLTIEKNFIFIRQSLQVFLIILIYLVLNLVYFKYSYLNYFLGTLFTFLFFLVFILSCNLRMNKFYLNKLFKFFIYFFIVASIFSLIQAGIQGTTLRWAKGVFREVGALAATLNVGTIMALVLYKAKNNKVYLIIALYFSIVVFITILKKSIITNAIVWIIFSLIFANKKYVVKLVFYYFLFVAILVPFVYSELQNNLISNLDYFNATGIEGHVRIGMYNASFKIANDYFPFGSGMGTFASLPSIFNGYSELYYKYNVDYIGSNSYNDVLNGAHTLFDTFWPHIIAELGYIGAILYIWLYSIPTVNSIKKLRLTSQIYLRSLLFYIISVSIIVFLEGFTLFTPEVPSFIFFHACLTGICYSYVKSISSVAAA